MKINYKFIPQGRSYHPSDAKNEVVLDVGGLNEGLVFDHHFPEGPEECASMLVFKNPARLNDLRNTQSITIVIHRDPDFDCSCAAWLVIRYLETGSYPEGSDQLVRYAETVDSGNLHIRNEFFFVPASLMYAFYISTQENPGKTSSRNSDEWILSRAFDLFDRCADIFKGGVAFNDDESLFRLLASAGQFNKEYLILQEDRKKYDAERLVPTLTEKIDNFRIFNKESGTISEVKALIYNSPPGSSLTKYWARNDGFILTIIPLKCDDRWQEVNWKPANFSGKPNRVIISVPPESPYSLKPLAIQLERSECEIERQLLGDSSELKRTRTVVRKGYEDEPWVINDDPWYDGSSHNYSIVDSPSSLSFLPTPRIITIALNHTKHDVTRASVTVIYPFLMTEEGKKISETWGNLFSATFRGIHKSDGFWQPVKNSPGNSLDSEGRDNYLFESVIDFLNLDGSNHDGTVWYEKIWNRDVSDYVLVRNKDKNRYEIAKVSVTSEKRTENRSIKEIRFIGFKSGVGFALVTADFYEIMTDEIPTILKRINQSAPAFRSFLNMDNRQTIFREPMYLVFAEYNGYKMNNLDIGHDVFSGCSFLDESVSLKDGSNERARMEKMLFRVTSGTVFGFARNCTMLASITRATHIDEQKKTRFLKTYEDRMNRFWLFEWILVMHQHWVMVNLKTHLGKANIDDRDFLNQLQSDYVEFTANSCFSQVTSDPTGLELYSRWKDLLTLDTLNQEVSSQIIAINNHVSSSIQSILTIITFIFFPMSLIISTLSFFEFADLSKAGFIEKIIFLIFIFAVCCVFWGVYISNIGKQLKRFLRNRMSTGR